MIIVAGARNLEEAAWLLSNGAEEVYCGLADVPNHRRRSLSVRDERELFEIVDLAKRSGKKSLLLLNQAWDPADYERLLVKVRRAVDRGVDGLVLKDLPLIDFLRSRGVGSAYILSSLALAFNSHAVELFRRYGIKRFILPYHLAPKDALGILRGKPHVETEIFYYPGHFCQNIDPLCAFCDWSKKYKPCKIRLHSAAGGFSMPSPDLSRMADILYDGHAAGVEYLKIPRTLDLPSLKKFLRDARALLRLLERGVSRSAFRARHAEVHVSDKV